MVPQFIEVTNNFTGEKYFFEIHKIVYVIDCMVANSKTKEEIRDGTEIWYDCDRYRVVKESKQEIMDKIEEIRYEQFERECSVRERIRKEY